MTLHRIAFAALLIGLASQAQVVIIGKEDPHFCDKVETIKPNLISFGDQTVRGRITDTQHAGFRSTKVQLRRLKGRNGFEVLKRVTTDPDGYFDLGFLAKGEYRLLASQDRSFSQPDTLECREKKVCVLNVELRINRTDMPESICPVR